jgi:hypothetical protein
MSDALLAIDPGAKACATATFVDKVLRYVGMYGPNDAAPWCSRAVVEIPERVNVAGVQADDLIRVAVAGARMAERCVRGAPGAVREIRPAEWKGSVPKPVHHVRAFGKLSIDEAAIVGGDDTLIAIHSAQLRGAADRWKKPGAAYYRARELPTVCGMKITHDLLDAVALGLYALGRLPK